MAGVTLEIKGVNRVGITHEVIACFAAREIDIVGMEVKPHYIYVKIPSVSASQLSGIVEMIKQVKGIENAKTIPCLPAEERENRIHTILTTVSEGILSVDDQLRVTAMNRAAQAMLRMEPEQLLHHSIENWWGEAAAEVKRCLHEAIELPSVQVRIWTGHKKLVSYLCSYHPIIPADRSERQGVVIVLRDDRQVQEWLSTVQKKDGSLFDEIVQQSANMRQCIDTAKRVAKSEATVFLQGESGTGKELFARAIHFESNRSQGPFVPINCAAIPDALLESELFGYEEGAFTGALKGGKSGLFEMAQGGTLFLDEIGDIPLHLQAKLLRVLEERSVRRVGGSRTIPIDVRIIAATNRNLSDMTSKGLFRDDLYYRLHVIPIVIPPLRERKSDIPMLAHYFTQRVCRAANRPVIPIAHSAIRALQAYPWPGNVRELQNVMERTVYLCPGDEIQEQHLYLDFPRNSSVEDQDSPLPSTALLKERMDAFEKSLLIRALKEHASIRKAAASLGISHTAVLQKMKKHGL